VQVPASQIELSQSSAFRQPIPPGQAGQVAPPQSTPVSSLFMIPSSQLDSAQAPSTHSPLRQSVPAVQALPPPHPSQVGPPQSSAVSSPFWIPSEQLGMRQNIARQTLLWQSVGRMHPRPASQAGHASPPQSIDVSLPLRTPSSHMPVGTVESVVASVSGGGRPLSSVRLVRSEQPKPKVVTSAMPMTSAVRPLLPVQSIDGP
jgi:hypothetical protein